MGDYYAQFIVYFAAISKDQGLMDECQNTFMTFFKKWQHHFESKWCCHFLKALSSFGVKGIWL